MKKSLIALAVAGALTAPIVAQADATLYGVAQFRLIDQDESSLNAQMSKTRLGVKGTVDNDIEGLTTGYQFEWEFAGANGDAAGVSDVRKSLVFLKGDFGQVTFGKQNNPVAAVKKADVFNRNSGVFTLNDDRIANAITYVTPTISGFEAYAGFTADGAAEDGTAATSTTVTAGTPVDVDGDTITFGSDVTVATAATDGSEDADTFLVGANYSVAGLGLSVAYNETNNEDSSTDFEVIGFGASYSIGDLYLGASYQERDNDAGNDVDTFDLAAKYTIGKFTLGAGYTESDEDGVADEEERALLAVNYALGSSASLNLEYADYDNSESEDNLVLQYTIGF